MFHNIHQISATIFPCVLQIPAQVLWTCEDRRCELYRPYKLWPGVYHLGSMPSQTPEHEPEQRARRKKLQLRRLKHEQLMLSLQLVSSKHILASKLEKTCLWCLLLLLIVAGSKIRFTSVNLAFSYFFLHLSLSRSPTWSWCPVRILTSSPFSRFHSLTVRS